MTAAADWRARELLTGIEGARPADKFGATSGYDQGKPHTRHPFAGLRRGFVTERPRSASDGYSGSACAARLRRRTARQRCAPREVNHCEKDP